MNGNRRINIMTKLAKPQGKIANDSGSLQAGEKYFHCWHSAQYSSGRATVRRSRAEI